ncbi:MAG: thioredoxin [Calditrichaeota bacterium]|nr:MAG: thioredoxin [Calditrichota bacterium]
MQRTIIILFSAFFVLLFWQCGQNEIEIPLQYKDSRDGQSLPYVIPNEVDLNPVDSLDAKLILPAELSANALAAHFVFGNTRRKLYFVLDKNNPRDVYYDRLWIDRNYDQDLRNDRAYTMSRGEFVSSRNFHYVEYDSLILPYTFSIGKKNKPFELFGKLYFWQPIKGSPTTANFLRDCWRQGEFEFEETPLSVILIDDDCNGLFDTRDNWLLFDQLSMNFEDLHYDDFRETTRLAWQHNAAFEIVKIESDGSGVVIRQKETELTMQEDISRNNPYLDEPQRPRAARSIAWLTNMRTAQRRARSTRKPILMHFTTTWSGPAATMEERTYHDAEVVGLSDKFVCLQIDGDVNRRLTEKYNVTSYPTTIILDFKSKEISRAIGYQPALEFSSYIAQFIKK